MVIEYAIEYSITLGSHVKTVVSTDIEKVIGHCKKNNINYIRRDPELCRDDTKIDDVLADAIEKKGKGCDYCSLVYGSMPTRYTQIFKRAYEFLKKHKNYDAVVSMQNVQKFHPEWMFKYSEKNIPRQKQAPHNRQSLSQMMIHDAHTLIFKTDEFYEKFKGITPYDKKHLYSIYGNKIKPLITNEMLADIDTVKDLKLIRAIMSNRT